MKLREKRVTPQANGWIMLPTHEIRMAYDFENFVTER